MFRELLIGLFYVVAVNRKLKYFIVERTTKANLKPLFMRGAFGTANSFFGILTTQYFSLVYVGLSNNLNPIATCLMAFFILREKMGREDILLLVIILIGIGILSVPSFFGTDSTQTEIAKPWFAWFGIIYVPLGLSFSNVIMRKMKGLHFI